MSAKRHKDVSTSSTTADTLILSECQRDHGDGKTTGNQTLLLVYNHCITAPTSTHDLKEQNKTSFRKLTTFVSCHPPSLSTLSHSTVTLHCSSKQEPLVSFLYWSSWLANMMSSPLPSCLFMSELSHLVC